MSFDPPSSPLGLNLLLGAVLGLAGLFMSFLGWLVESPWLRRHHTRDDKVAKIPDGHRTSMVVGSSIVSTGTVLGLLNLLPATFLATGPASLPRIVFEGLAILLTYDLGYYLLHRFVLHEWTWGSRIHAIHHRIRTPFTRDSLYVHPLETAAGVGLLMCCTWLVGPVHPWSFGWAFLLYSTLNVFIHSAFYLPQVPFRWLSRLAANHDVHHASMKGGYYASITPLWDIVFRTNR